MKKALSVINFYVLCNKLKNVVRTGWLNWHVNATRVESVAEHVYGVLMLALAMYSEYQYDIDIEKVMFMLAIHELEETIIGDLTYLDIDAKEKMRIGHQAVENILADLINGDEIKRIILEFDERKTKEAVFAYHCDKLECDLQCKLYDEAGYVDPLNQGDSADHLPDVMEKLKRGEITWSSSWMNNDRVKFVDDENFLEVLEFAMREKITDKGDKLFRK